MPLDQNLLLCLVVACSDGIFSCSDIPTDDELRLQILLPVSSQGSPLFNTLPPLIDPIGLVVSPISNKNAKVLVLLVVPSIWPILVIDSWPRSWASLPRSDWNVRSVRSTPRGPSRSLIDLTRVHLSWNVVRATFWIPPLRLRVYISVVWSILVSRLDPRHSLNRRLSWILIDLIILNHPFQRLHACILLILSYLIILLCRLTVDLGIANQWLPLRSYLLVILVVVSPKESRGWSWRLRPLSWKIKLVWVTTYWRKVCLNVTAWDQVEIAGPLLLELRLWSLIRPWLIQAGWDCARWTHWSWIVLDGPSSSAGVCEEVLDFSLVK